MPRSAVLAIALLMVGMFSSLVLNALAAQWSSAPYENPGAPLRHELSMTDAAWDFQLHNRDNPVVMDAPMQAQHGPDCSPPPASHIIQDMRDGAFICAGHVMTSLNSHGYGEIILTPNQLLNCSAGCVVQWDMSTQKMSGRDWPDLWLTPYVDNLTLPFEMTGVDLQGFPRSGIHLTASPGQGSWIAQTINNYQATDLSSAWWIGMHEGVVAGTNQAAIRQTFRLTIQPGGLKFERLASPTASAFVWTLNAAGQPGFAACACLLASDYVVQWGHHSYTPEKDGAGVPATWHWGPFSMSNSSPFTIIKPQNNFRLINNGGIGSGGQVTFEAPAPTNAYLRFSAICKVSTDANNTPGTFTVAPKQVSRDFGHVASYFIPIAPGRQTVNFQFSGDDWFTNWDCHAKDFAIWSRNSGPVPTPTNTPIVVPTATPVVVPTATNTPLPVPTATPVQPTVTPTPKTYVCAEMVPGGGLNNDIIVWTRVGGGICP